MKFSHLSLFLLLTFIFDNVQAQMLSTSERRSKELQESLTPLRSSYDVYYYHLDVAFDLQNQSLEGSNEFHFTVVEDLNKLQFDLFKNLLITSITYKNRQLPFTREANAVFITFPTTLKKGSKEKFIVGYQGVPQKAVNPPWDGGIVFSKDDTGNPFISVASQGLGASVWWPNKDHQSDEVDSMMVSLTVPKEFDAVSNGKLQNAENIDGSRKKYNWFVSNPINNYNTTFYIGKFTHWKKMYPGTKGPLELDFWALKTDSTRAKPHWEQNTTKMLTAFEYWFGPFPWYKDGFKLVQAPFIGMEHQSAIAYGNQFKNGYLGTDLSGTGHGLKWDYTIVHESGHEWWGNNITTKDLADRWVHESFTTYAEALYTEYYFGERAGSEYVRGLRKNIKNTAPIVAKYGASPDMSAKGANMIHMIRAILSNDQKFRKILHGIQENFGKKTTTGQEIERYISSQAGFDFSKVFDQYLRQTKLPTLEYQLNNNRLNYRWSSDVNDFNMPIKVAFDQRKFRFIQPTSEWQSVLLSEQLMPIPLEIDPTFYINLRKIN